MAHITGGGITDNLPRVLPQGTAAAHRSRQRGTVPPLFQWLQRSGDVPDDDMLRTFNMGIGLILVCTPALVDAVLEDLRSRRETPVVIGEIVRGDLVSYACRKRSRRSQRHCDVTSHASHETAITRSIDPTQLMDSREQQTSRRADLGARLQSAGASSTRSRTGRLRAAIALVISNIPNAAGLERARAAGIETARHAAPGLADADGLRSRAGRGAPRGSVDLVCLAGFMRLLGPTFIDAFPNRILNIHPSLLPAFPGLDAQRQALSTA